MSLRRVHDHGDLHSPCAGSHSRTRSSETLSRACRYACRFLLTFDDGPDTGPSSNSALVLEHLAKNRIQPDVKAVFFVQTRNSAGGGCEYGRFLLRREHTEGHVLGLHSGTVRGHVSHTRMSSEELQQSLVDGIEDITKVIGQRPLLVRPPYWWFNAETLSQYEAQGLNMLLSDIYAYDGTNWGWHVFRRPNIRSQLRKVFRRYVQQGLPGVDGCTPVVVTFHDTNGYTAKHMEEYLHILIEEAERLQLPLDQKPFYDNAAQIAAAALERTVRSVRQDT